MHVSKIEMRGFKSFGNTKVSLPLSSCLTAIVGPNGSGKSNIIEAFCFVLGWMSAKTMRAERFSDLLFNGGNGQRPAPFAEVSLHFDNSDGVLPVDSKTVVIARRVDRSGKCVYRLNKKRASRQEIVDLLSKVMSSPGGYNFIMQGDVDRFIKMNPLERRSIIDDLAGIAEYDEKKEKSLAELQRVETNLQSMGAILNEIGMQMEKLRIEKEGAMRYRQLKNQLEQGRAMLLLAQQNICGRKLSEIQRKISAKNGELSELRDESQKIADAINQHERKIKQLDKLIHEKQSADILAAAENLRERIRTLTEMIASTNDEQTAVKTRIANVQAEIKKVSGEAQRVAGEGPERLLREIEKISTKFTELRDEFDGLLQTLDRADRRSFTDVRKVLGRAQKVLHDMRPIINDFDGCIKRTTELWNKFPQVPTGDLRKPESELQGLQADLISLEGQHVQLDKRFEELQRKVQEARVALETASKRGDEVQKSIRAMCGEKESSQRKISSLRGRATRIQEEIQALEGKLQEYRIEEARLQTQLDATERESKRIKVRVKEVKHVDPSKLEREIEKVEAELETIGPVNERAIRDFRNTERRYSAQKAQYDKLVGERQSILDFMREIDQKKTEVFMKTFNEISKNFGKIFSELSPGGSARLILENPEHPLDGGLEIEAKPAGKEVVHVGAMSGGERALTALAFIFSIQRARPTALYVLDEIDAHLDDENLRRVAEMLHRSSRETQIVVVTLRDSMMSVADRLFGVSMDSSGVSRMVSVELAGLAA
ncbi:MAG: AAA family ATPase [Candidatus Hodarchaeaceae archaeon]|nr:AAA family ATPase [Candidatus Hodarchaeaceae archaeon]